MILNRCRISALVDVLDARLVSLESKSHLENKSHQDVEFLRVTTDTRAISVGDLFVALKGERFDAHDFAEQAKAAGAVALVVDHELNVDIPQLIVTDTRIALGKIAEYNRTFFEGTLFAITGSSGKTTVKEMLAEILSGAGQVLATKGNLNNEIGVPLTLLSLSGGDQYAVIEMGASGAGEIAYSAHLAHPDIALISNAMGAHLAGFGSLQGVVEAKGEIYDALSAVGIAVINRDDPHADQWIKRSGDRRIISFAQNVPDADIKALQLLQHDNGCYSFTLSHDDECESVHLNVMGRHNVSNALAAAALTVAAGLPLSLAAAGLGRFQAVKGRMCSLEGVMGARVIDDSYNANPGSVKAAIQVLNELKGERVLILGDMGELGADAEQMHRDIGQFAAEHKIDKLLAVGPLSKAAVEGYQDAQGLMAEHFSDQQSLVNMIRPCAHPGMVILIKGSRSAGMDKVVSRLTEEV
ncbi:UDP-N-acetylmuramoyl-tripeptide--D-alanyl-D-alanine ligase [Neptunomonas antarctica]|uniref:UDP-N-acetylmuramoyl-tripeptide--D-alanyl-D-alanine ligase n=1 Tax=Neptunomonas antarctica TaxID=619304 RepID=A0A1N7PFS9_9GAMM|nr:UDP-N-acetylmuramoyl-tripeptide--D-alanyl-D-alanine ligase [Neptunomonas antarctica]SIT09444.1 UDP-N-acetylmuramoyl-tripeptide--D-alanyl-D-alanine ligase [Neptunomonas antarctica]